MPMNTELGSDAVATSADEANQVNLDVVIVADEANFKTETDEESKSSVVADQASVEAACSTFPPMVPKSNACVIACLELRSTLGGMNMNKFLS